MIESIFSHFMFAFIYPGIILGVILLAASCFIPTVMEQYKILMRVIGLVLIIFFVFQDGRMSESEKYEKQLAASEIKIADMEKRSAKINTQIVTEYVDRIKYVDKIKEIKTNVYITEKDDSACIISPDASDSIRLLINSAAKGRIPDAPISVDGKAK